MQKLLIYKGVELTVEYEKSEVSRRMGILAVHHKGEDIIRLLGTRILVELADLLEKPK